MLPYLGDIDLMVNSSFFVAIPTGYSVDEFLLTSFIESVSVFELHEFYDTVYPAHVYLQHVGLVLRDINRESGWVVFRRNKGVFSILG